MSASAFPYGMVPVSNYGSGYNTQGFDTWTIFDGYATSIFYGDVVEVATGYVLDSQCWPASLTTGYTVYAKVQTFSWSVFQIQGDGPVPMTALMDNAAIVQTAGNTTYPKKSRNALNTSSIATTSSLPLRIVGLVETPNNAWGDAYTDVLVVFNNNQQLLNSTGV